MKFKFYNAFFLCFLIFVCIGCGENKFPSVRWEGNVTLAGKEIPADATARITVSLNDATTQSQVATAPIVGGHYILENVPKGQVSVQFNIVLESPAKNPEDAARGIMVSRDLLPKNFVNGLAEAAKEDDLAKNFDLK